MTSSRRNRPRFPAFFFARNRLTLTRIIFCLVVLWLGSAPAFGAPPLPEPEYAGKGDGSVRAKIELVRTAIDQAIPFKVEFVQELYSDGDTDGYKDLEESGEILFKNQTQLIWTYLEPDYKVFLLEGDNYKFYDRDSEQMILGTIEDKNRQWIWRLLFSDDIIPYTRLGPGWNSKDGSKTFILKNPEEPLDVEITLDRRMLPGKVVQLDPSGARIVYFFKNYRPKIVIPANAFQLKVPEGVEIIRYQEEENNSE